jgi:hypothetical protein
VIFGLAVVVAFPLYLWLGRDQWFFLDDWDLLAGRSARSVDDLLRPHNEHWMPLPILVYRGMWHLVGIRSYWPYQAMTITLHLVAASLIWLVMRRAGIRPWIGTAAGLLFLFFGSGRDNILWSFQINFVGSLVAGLLHLLLADHDGPRSRRDALGLAFGLVGLLCSALSVTMTVVVAVAVALRRGWRPAAWHSAPLGVVFIAWWLFYGRAAYHQPLPGVGEVARFVRDAVGNLFATLGQLPVVGLLLAALAVLGLVVAWSERRADLRGRLAPTVALCTGLAVFVASTSLSRWQLLPSLGSQSGRYAHVMAAMVLPLVALGADAVVTRWRVAIPVVAGALLFGIPGNVSSAELHGRDRIVLGNSHLIVSLPRSPFATTVPRSVEPLPDSAPHLTIGWLLDGVQQGRVPQPQLTAVERANASLRIALHASPGNAVGRCSPLDGPERRLLSAGEAIAFGGGDVEVQLDMGAGSRSSFLVYRGANGDRLEAIAGPLELQIRPAPAATGVVLCG